MSFNGILVVDFFSELSAPFISSAEIIPYLRRSKFTSIVSSDSIIERLGDETIECGP